MLNNKFENDFVWITQLEVLKNGGAMTNPLFSGGTSATMPGQNPAAAAARPRALRPASRATNCASRGSSARMPSKQQVFYKYYDSLVNGKDAEEFFAKPPADQKPEVETGATGENRYAYKFKFRLPLVKDTMKFEK